MSQTRRLVDKLGDENSKNSSKFGHKRSIRASHPRRPWFESRPPDPFLQLIFKRSALRSKGVSWTN